MKKSNSIPTVLAVMGITFLASFAIGTTDGKSTVRIDLTMTPEQRAQLLTPVKTEIHNTEIKVTENGKTTVHTYVTAGSRGQSSMAFARKNLKMQSVYKDVEGKSQKMKIAGIESRKLILSAGSVDPLVTKNMTVYRLYDLIGLKTMKTAYAEVTINGVSQGLHMVSESPDDYVIKTLNADVAFRRGYVDKMELRESKKSLSEAEVAGYTAALDAVYTDIKTLKGAELLASLERRMNFKNYLRMLAMNYLVKNGDYYDELYLYGFKNSKGEMYFDVFPWDFDDSFASGMHLSIIPGYSNFKRSDRSEKQMIYSFESRIDMAISQDPVLLNAYFEVFEEVVSKVTAANINNVFHSVATLLAPYAHNPDVLRQGAIDAAKAPYSSQAIFAGLHSRQMGLVSEVQKAQVELAEIRTETESRAEKLNKFQNILSRLQQKLIRRHVSK